MNTKPTAPRISQLSQLLVEELLDRAEELRLGVSRMENGSTLVDAGIKVRGGLEAGRRVAEICMGGLGTVNFRAASGDEPWSWHVDVSSANPVIACLASQYAGWSLSHGKGKGAFNALGSGPARAIGSREELFEELGYRDNHDRSTLVIEVDTIPPVEIAEYIAERCSLQAENLTLILTPTSSLAGSVQIVARVLETSLHKAHALGFEPGLIVDGAGSAPLCPPSPDFLTAMSRTNDAILFAGQVHLFVNAEDDETEQLANSLPSSASQDYGAPFGEVFKAVGYDFYKIDPMLFSPARVAVTALKSGRTYHAGRIDRELLNKSFS